MAQSRATRSAAKARSVRNADWAFHASDAAVFSALASGRRVASLREYFGAPAYAELCSLAAAKKKAHKRRGPSVLILPGIMGSRLGGRMPLTNRRGVSRRSSVLWIDPLEIAAGRLTAMRLPSNQPLEPQGVLLFSYAKLKLQLELAGCDASFHCYDWRLGIDELGAQLAARISAHGRPLVLIAHSMGGLVARAAARLLPKPLLRKLIMLGAPNQGSFAPVQALRGTYPFVRNLSTLDRKHSAEHLAQQVFCTFPGLYHMLPRQRIKGLDLYDARSWPADGPVPDSQLLSAAETAARAWAPADSRMVHIIGVNQETVVDLRRTASGFEYVMDRNGDGTVPLKSARLPKLKCLFVDEAHADLATNPRVIQAIIDLVHRGRTAALPHRWRARPGVRRRISDAKLREAGKHKIDWLHLTPAQREAVFAELDSGRLLPAARHPIA